uniref:Uncharacterized protein n=1 Tax=uncultured bacterium Contig1772 TaxID=1393512 RepID=W0FQP2_9BACT|nr:hypothetical protein [uncultured bacterium Contig1772]
MASRKPSANAKRVSKFKAELGGLDDIFAREERRADDMSAKKEAALRDKACESKNRYPTRYDAQEAIDACAAHGKTGLHSYRCPYCKGWHLTSKPPRES